MTRQTFGPLPEPLPIIVTETGNRATDGDVNSLFHPPEPLPLVPILDENGREMLNTQNILVIIDPAYVPPYPPHVDALDKQDKPIPNTLNFVMRNDPAYIPQAPPNPIPVPYHALLETSARKFLHPDS